jgi:hypothetical protein
VSVPAQRVVPPWHATRSDRRPCRETVARPLSNLKLLVIVGGAGAGGVVKV